VLRASAGEHVERLLQIAPEHPPPEQGHRRVEASPCRSRTRHASRADTILSMSQQLLAPTPIHGEYRERGDKVD